MNKGSVVIFMLCQLQIKSFLALIQLWWKSFQVFVNGDIALCSNINPGKLFRAALNDFINQCSLFLCLILLWLSLTMASHILFQFYKLFWAQACLEGIGTNGTHRSHARCHPYPIPQPVKVGHTTGVYVPYSFQTVVWVLLRPTRTDQ